ncbi:MAG: T9SS type A sorting domain-containing protein [Bacteroidota bacterium]|nr:T9SS type A sorting domain-containing protein [Bacteroidota bacterium]
MKKRILILSLLTLLISDNLVSQPTYPTPYGVFCSCGPTTGTGFGSVDPTIAALPFVKGILVRVAWNLIEPTEGAYNWSLIDNQISAANSYNKKISLAIGNGKAIPNWVYTAGAQQLTATVPFLGAINIATPWDATYLTKWKNFVQALGNRYKNDTTIVLVYITNSSTNGIEMQVPTTVTPSWNSIGYTTTKMIASWDTIVNAFDAAFPNHFLSNDFHPVNGSNVVADSVYIYANSKIGARYGASAWWWTQHNTTVYPAQYLILQNSTSSNNFSGIQMAYNGTSDSASFGAGGMPAALQLAISNNVCYWEIWNQDLLNPNFTTLLTNASCSTTGLNDFNELTDGLAIFPNPANNSLTIKIQNSNQQINKVTVYNSIGQIEIKTTINRDENSTLDLKKLSNGVYFLRIDSNANKSLIKRFVVSK